MVVGQSYHYSAIPAGEVWSPEYPDGRVLSFFFSPLFTLYLVSSILVIVQLFKRGYRDFLPKSSILFFLVVLVQVFTAAQSQYNPTFSVLYSVSGLGILSLTVLWYHEWREYSKPQKREFLLVLSTVVGMCLLFEVGIAFAQFVTTSTLGLLIEESKNLPVFGLGADEKGWKFRPIGTKSHANILAYFLVTLLASFISLRASVQDIWKDTLAMTTIFLTVFLLLLTQSRAAYLAILFAVTVFALREKRNWQKMVNVFWTFCKKNAVLFLLASTLLLLVVPARLYYSRYSFVHNAGVETRQNLLTEAFELIRQEPQGVGKGMFIPALFDHSPSGIVRYFAEAVHNGFVLFLAENGVFALILGFYAYLLLFRHLQTRVSTQTYSYLLFGLVSTLIIPLFHPFDDFINPFIMIAIAMTTAGYEI